MKQKVFQMTIVNDIHETRIPFRSNAYYPHHKIIYNTQKIVFFSFDIE